MPSSRCCSQVKYLSISVPHNAYVKLSATESPATYSITQRRELLLFADPALFVEEALIWLLRLSCRLSAVGEELAERSEFERVVSVGDTNGLLALLRSDEVQVVPDWKRGPMLRGVKRICDGGGTSWPEPKVTEYVGTRSSDGNANFSESYTFSTSAL